jgi:hypothetical protein
LFFDFGCKDITKFRFLQNIPPQILRIAAIFFK